MEFLLRNTSAKVWRSSLTVHMVMQRHQYKDLLDGERPKTLKVLFKDRLIRVRVET